MHPFVQHKGADGTYDYKNLDEPFDKMREEGFIDGIEDTFIDDEKAIE